MISRRSLITGLATLLAAPALVRASSIMPVKAWGGGRVHGYVAFSPTLAVNPAFAWHVAAAGETIYNGDAIELRNGMAYRYRGGVRPMLGIAIGNSHQPHRIIF